MEKKMPSTAQSRCDEKVLLNYFCGIGIFCSVDRIKEKIYQLMTDIPNEKIYIGVTHHPCGRFSGNKDATSALPSYMPYKYGFSEELITEAGHYLEYDRMYLIWAYHPSEHKP